MSWKVPRIWEGGECWIIGGGPSMPKQFGVPDDVIKSIYAKELSPTAYSPYLAPIHQKHVIGVNMAFLIGNWIDMCFFGDKRWFFDNRKTLAEFPGLKVTCHPFFNGHHKDENIKSIARDRNHPKGISLSPHKASWNANSGAAAISVAANMGATRIILLGFDMRLDEINRQHWHGLYNTAKREQRDPKGLPFRRHLSGFPVIAADAKKRGIEIINASPDSTIPDFPKMSVHDVLKLKKREES